MIIGRGEWNMTKNRIVKYAANTALLAVLAVAGIGVYQIGTYTPDKEIQEELQTDQSEDTEETPMVDADTSLVDAEISDTTGQNDTAEEKITQTLTDSTDSSEKTSDSVSTNEVTTETANAANAVEDSMTDQEKVTDVSASALSAPKLSFSEDTLMEWPVHGTILLDYNMDQTVYFPTLDQYKLSPAIAVQAVEGAPVTAAADGTVYSIEEDAQTGTTLTMELGSGYQAVYGQLKDLCVEEGDTVTEGTVIGYVSAPTKYYSKEGNNLYFAMKKDGKPIDPIAYLP